MKLWQKEYSVDEAIEAFTVGDDPQLDMRLVPYDCVASKAHASMLNNMGILTNKETGDLHRELGQIIKLHKEGKFGIKQSEEDCHTAIENHLTKVLGDPGKKIHTARSRNDQILTALRLYYKDIIRDVTDIIRSLMDTIAVFIQQNGNTPLPGYTHTRKAMPTTVGVWADCLNEAMGDNLISIEYLMDLIDSSPLGTAAGYGVSLDIDRDFTATALGFKKIQKNPIYAQHSRGKYDATIIHILSQIMFDLNRFSSDLILFTEPGFNYFILPDNMTTGSSIMPQKKNPDVFELIRAKYHTVVSLEMQVKQLSANLIMGYHRDYQLLKKAVFESIDITLSSLHIINYVFQKLKVDNVSCANAMTDEIYATEKAYRLVRNGIPFRDAYKQVAKELNDSKI
ncbi:MAG: argininosuccinate lyase [Candidatus Marinimicrobia bacterium]|nr:argininosuccinate lyase [Candidatus Neomarinimicrobiota bacterium]